jgi:hypothetical protein
MSSASPVPHAQLAAPSSPTSRPRSGADSRLGSGSGSSSSSDPSAGTRWSVLLAYALLAGATQLLWVTYTPITTDSAAEWGVSVDAVGWLATV